MIPEKINLALQSSWGFYDNTRSIEIIHANKNTPVCLHECYQIGQILLVNIDMT